MKNFPSNQQTITHMRNKIANVLYAIATLACACEFIISLMLERVDVAIIFAIFFAILCFGAFADKVAAHYAEQH